MKMVKAKSTFMEQSEIDVGRINRASFYEPEMHCLSAAVKSHQTNHSERTSEGRPTWDLQHVQGPVSENV